MVSDMHQTISSLSPTSTRPQISPLKRTFLLPRSTLDRFVCFKYGDMSRQPQNAHPSILHSISQVPEISLGWGLTHRKFRIILETSEWLVPFFVWEASDIKLKMNHCTWGKRGGGLELPDSGSSQFILQMNKQAKRSSYTAKLLLSNILSRLCATWLGAPGMNSVNHVFLKLMSPES